MALSQQLIDLLTQQTQELKAVYIERTKEWAIVYFNTMVTRASWKEEDWAKYFGVATSIANEGSPSAFVTFFKGFHNTKDGKRYHTLRNEALKVRTAGLQKVVDAKVKLAERHYEDSVLKLAHRVTDKGLDVSKMTIVSGKVGINLELLLSDGTKQVKAWTIWAEGEIKAPHFRYLVK